MKKLLSLGFVLLLLSIAASAQVNVTVRRSNSSITKIESIQLHRDHLRYKITQRNARRDGIITPLEKRRIQKARRKYRIDSFRFRNNDRRR